MTFTSPGVHLQNKYMIYIFVRIYLLYIIMGGHCLKKGNHFLIDHSPLTLMNDSYIGFGGDHLLWTNESMAITFGADVFGRGFLRLIGGLWVSSRLTGRVDGSVINERGPYFPGLQLTSLGLVIKIRFLGKVPFPAIWNRTLAHWSRTFVIMQ